MTVSTPHRGSAVGRAPRGASVGRLCERCVSEARRLAAVDARRRAGPIGRAVAATGAARTTPIGTAKEER